MNPVKPIHILVVEDEPRNAALIEAMLKIAGGAKTWLCRSGDEVTTVIAQMPQIDLVLLDLQLPGENGYAILARLRSEPICQSIPMVAVTAQVMPDDITHAETAGFDGFLGKPLNFDRFPGQIRRLLAGERVWEPR